MKASLLARLVLGGFLAIFAFAGAYLLLDSLGVWPRIPASVSKGMEVLTGLILVGTLAGHLALATGKLPVDSTDRERT
ncbi:MAG TPA: hypothetical protein VN971_09465 [Thermoanaerobaculia bacterium]|nr:hypothetical protein [Thermoanaerobaculia bacterium]